MLKVPFSFLLVTELAGKKYVNKLTGKLDLNQQGEMWQTVEEGSMCLYPRDYLGMSLTHLCPIELSQGLSQPSFSKELN